MDRRRQFFGESVGGTIIRLVLLSIVVGIVLSALGITPYNIVERFQLLVQRIADLGFDAFHWAFTYFLLGAMVVIPIWFIVRLVDQASDRPRPFESSGWSVDMWPFDLPIALAAASPPPVERRPSRSAHSFSRVQMRDSMSRLMRAEQARSLVHQARIELQQRGAGLDLGDGGRRRSRCRRCRSAECLPRVSRYTRASMTVER